jgi:hypothetical protein
VADQYQNHKNAMGLSLGLVDDNDAITIGGLFNDAVPT